jgi:4-amino-4-deoxy-L-arabinose transferase-like glycosyltransferase
MPDIISQKTHYICGMEQTIPAKQLNWLYLFIALAVAVNFSGLFVTIMGPDAALYATISKTMVLHHDYLNIIVNGHDWLDKPHFPFWIAAISFNLFGISTWSYKLPGILFLLMGALYTYHLAKSLYNERIALWSVLILLTAQHILLSNNDVRAEPYLTGLIVAAIYHFYKANIRNNYRHLLAGCIFTACAIMTKGMFAIIPIGGAIAGQLTITKDWKRLFNWKWLVAIILTLIFIIPEIYCLYYQFDIHPEKIVFDHTNVSGIKFFFWDSQFGRFFNSGPIKGNGDPLFFVHTTLWAFLPWSLLFFVSIYRFINTGIKNPKAQEWYCISAALLTFLLFSASKFQLPHYMNIVFPFFAIITAQYLYGVQLPKSIKAIRVTQISVIAIMITLICTIEYFFYSVLTTPVLIILFLLCLAMVMVPKIVSLDGIQRIIISTVLVSFIVNVYLNMAFYPTLLQYQAGSQAAEWINQHDRKDYPLLQCDNDAWPMEFYLNRPLQIINPDTIKSIPKNTFYLYANPDVIKRLQAKGWPLLIVDTLQRYQITRLKGSFLNKKTRASQLTPMQIALINPPGMPVLNKLNINPVSVRKTL